MSLPHTIGLSAESPQPLMGDLLQHGAQRLRRVSASARLDCDLLMAHALRVDRAAVYARSREAVEPQAAERFLKLLDERSRGRPVAQIIGRKEFYSLEFEVAPQVLAPRPETELLVEVVLNGAPDGRLVCVELGTGSGAVAVALARARPHWRMIATDVSEDALDVARRNAERHAPGRISLVDGSWYDALARLGRAGVIVSNPPYVESGLCGEIPLCFEPPEALDGGSDGLDELKEVIGGAPGHLKKGGLLAVEHGARQGEVVRALFRAAGFGEPNTYRDLAGQERVTAACRG